MKQSLTFFFKSVLPAVRLGLMTTLLVLTYGALDHALGRNLLVNSSVAGFSIVLVLLLTVETYSAYSRLMDEEE